MKYLDHSYNLANIFIKNKKSLIKRLCFCCVFGYLTSSPEISMNLLGKRLGLTVLKSNWPDSFWLTLAAKSALESLSIKNLASPIDRFLMVNFPLQSTSMLQFLAVESS